MNILHSVQVDGFWGTKTLTIDFHRDVNFLIGVNGSGKTTLINMIAAALSADLPMLDRLPFETMHLHLQDTEGRRKPVIEVHRHIGKESPFPRVSYTVRDKSSDPPAIYELDDMVQQRTYSREHIIYRERIRRAGYAIVEHLKRLVQLTWLTIHRIPITGLRGEDRNFESTVDKKVDQMSTELVKYFSLLNRQADAEQAKFQEAVFLSLLAQQSSNAFVEIAKLDLAQEREALAQIFEKFKLERPAFVPLLEQHFDEVQSALDAAKKGYTTTQVAAIFAMSRIHSVVQEWHKLIEQQHRIYEPQDGFLGILNKMMVKKEYRVSEKNELNAVLLESNSSIPLTELSSGEKQLLIILGEALLQQRTPTIYIADEPELSLHVAWQVQLVENLRRLNPEAQIIVATHSPEIVSSFGSQVFNMEDLLP